jgi:hypothetical protein
MSKSLHITLLIIGIVSNWIIFIFLLFRPTSGIKKLFFVAILSFSLLLSEIAYLLHMNKIKEIYFILKVFGLFTFTFIMTTGWHHPQKIPHPLVKKIISDIIAGILCTLMLRLFFLLQGFLF